MPLLDPAKNIWLEFDSINRVLSGRLGSEAGHRRVFCAATGHEGAWAFGVKKF